MALDAYIIDQLRREQERKEREDEERRRLPLPLPEPPPLLPPQSEESSDQGVVIFEI